MASAQNLGHNRRTLASMTETDGITLPHTDPKRGRKLKFIARKPQRSSGKVLHCLRWKVKGSHLPIVSTMVVRSHWGLVHTKGHSLDSPGLNCNVCISLGVGKYRPSVDRLVVSTNRLTLWDVVIGGGLGYGAMERMSVRASCQLHQQRLWNGARKLISAVALNSVIASVVLCSSILMFYVLIIDQFVYRSYF